MLRYVRTLLSVFLLLAICLIGVFVANNWQDISAWRKFSNTLDEQKCFDKEQETTEALVLSDENANDYQQVWKEVSELSQCLGEQSEQFFSSVSLTGLSLGLRSLFNTIEEVRSLKRKKYQYQDKDKEVYFWGTLFGLVHLKLNNLAIKKCCQNYSGFEFLYPLYLGRLKDYIDEAQEFSNDLIFGLKSNQGIVNLPEVLKPSAKESLALIIQNKEMYIKQSQEIIDSEISRLKSKERK